MHVACLHGESVSSPSDDKARLYTNLASAAESGMDFSSRWLSDRGNLSTIRTTDVLPVDLNAILCGNEALLANLHKIAGSFSNSDLLLVVCVFFVVLPQP